MITAIAPNEMTDASAGSTPAPTGGFVPPGCITVVVPAYNESGRISVVLDAISAAPEVTEIIVVDDGSPDNTGDVARAHPAAASGKLRVLRHDPNKGKGAAMRTGAEAARTDVLVFLDADLIGLRPEHVGVLAAPVASGEKVMALGVLRDGRGATDLGQFLSPNITGQRCIRRDLFLTIPSLDKAGYGVELAITAYVIEQALPMGKVILRGITHTMKEEKLGFVRGFFSRLKMYWQMTPYLIRRFTRRAKKPGQS